MSGNGRGRKTGWSRRRAATEVAHFLTRPLTRYVDAAVEGGWEVERGNRVRWSCVEDPEFDVEAWCRTMPRTVCRVNRWDAPWLSGARRWLEWSCVCVHRVWSHRFATDYAFLAIGFEATGSSTGFDCWHPEMLLAKLKAEWKSLYDRENHCEGHWSNQKCWLPWLRSVPAYNDGSVERFKRWWALLLKVDTGNGEVGDAWWFTRVAKTGQDLTGERRVCWWHVDRKSGCWR